MGRMYFVPHGSPPFCDGLTEGHNRGKLCAINGCGITNHPKNLIGELLTLHAYLTLPGTNLLHPLPILDTDDYLPIHLRRYSHLFDLQ